jgi:integrase
MMTRRHLTKEVIMATTRPTALALKPCDEVRPGRSVRPGTVTWRDERGKVWIRAWTTDWYDAGGCRRTKRFGREGKVSRRHAQARYDDWLANEWQPKEHVRNPAGDLARYRVADLCDDYQAHAGTIYVKRGRQTTTMSEVIAALRCLRDACGELSAATVEAPQIASLRDSMIWSESGGMRRALGRGTVNGRLRVIQQGFAWAHAEKGRVPQAVAVAVSMVAPLRQGRSAAHEPEEVRPVAWDVVERTIDEASSVVADMIGLQWLTGMRPDEVCVMRGCDLQTASVAAPAPPSAAETKTKKRASASPPEPVWVYRPEHHKTEHHGKAREVCLGPKAIEIVRPYLRPEAQGYLFSPRAAVAEWAAESGHRQDPSRAGDRYTTRGYRQAIHRACDRAFPFPGERKPTELRKLTAEELAAHRAARAAWQEKHRWNPNQLRHAWATAVRRQFGVEASKVGLGHSDIKTAEIYAERDRERAMDVARKVG